MDTHGGSTLASTMQNIIATVAPTLDVMKGMNIPFVSKALQSADKKEITDGDSEEFAEVK